MRRILACALCALLFLGGCSTGNYTIPGSSVKKKAASKSKAATKSETANKKARANFLKNLKKKNAATEKKAKRTKRLRKKDSVGAWKENVHPPKDQRYITNYFSR